MVPYLRFPMKLDSSRMLVELERLEGEGGWLSHPDYTVAEAGAWTAIALVSTDGDHKGPESLRYRGAAKGKPTELLQMCPYLQEVIGTFKTDVLRARLMSLKPGTNIAEHRDYGAQRYSFERGVIRVHTPIRTDQGVAWKLSGTKIPLEAGYAYYVNVCLPHAVENLSPVDRVHLVLDMRVNDWVRGIFPKPSITDRIAALVLPRVEPTALMIKEKIMSQYGRLRKILGDIGLRRLRDNISEALQRYSIR